MQHTLSLFAVIAFVATNALADEPAGEQHDETELRLFDPNVFGKTPSDPVTLLLPGAQLIQPQYIQVDLRDGHYVAATITYDKINFEAARRSLNKRYKKYEYLADMKDFALWRNVDDEYAIQLSSFDNEDKLRILYIKFPPASVMLESMRKAGVFGNVTEPAEQGKPEPADARESPR